MLHVFIVVLSWNGEKDTLACLESLQELHVKNCQLSIVVVDNGSDKPFTIYHFPFSIGELKIIRKEENFGFSGGNNVGIKYALDNGADYVVILNNDTIVDKDLIEELLKVAESDKQVGIVAPKIYFAKGYEFHKSRYAQSDLGNVIWYTGGVMDWNNVIGSHRGVDEVDHGQYEALKKTDFATGCCMMVKKEVFKKVGLLDEKYFLYYEDSDFSQRVKKAGYTIMYSPKAFLWHKNAGSAGGSGSNLQDYYITRNRLLFGVQYAPLRSCLALIKESIKLLIKGREYQKKGIIDFYLQKWGKGSFVSK